MSRAEPALASDELARRAAEIHWYHSMDLGHGLRTAGATDPAASLPRLHLPANLHGRRVLDVGAWDGFYSFECERRGADEVVATDSFAWSAQNWSSKAGFELAREALGSRVRAIEVDVMDLSEELVGGTYDLVLFLGVLYHLRDPVAALGRVASVTAPGGLLVVETHVDALWTRRPTARFYAGQELAFDPTNWWGPNPEAVRAMLAAAGFTMPVVVSPDSTAYRMTRAARRAAAQVWRRIRRRAPAPGAWAQGRCVIHARRAPVS
jgi:tRNA (mo5U34)-methyltransferase